MAVNDIDHFRCDNGRWLHCVGFDLCETWAGDGRGEKKNPERQRRQRRQGRRWSEWRWWRRDGRVQAVVDDCDGGGELVVVVNNLWWWRMCVGGKREI